MQVFYRSLEEMLDMIDEPTRSLCFRFLSDNRDILTRAPGASHNHQVWKGGYLDHIQESMNIGVVFYELLQKLRPLPFSLSDVLLVLFLHDLEKPWRYKKDEAGGIQEVRGLDTKEERRRFQNKKLADYGFQLTPPQENALRYVEGEIDNYTPFRRMMGPLAAFCHLADITSARIWFGYPLSENDPWNGAKRRG